MDDTIRKNGYASKAQRTELKDQMQLLEGRLKNHEEGKLIKIITNENACRRHRHFSASCPFPQARGTQPENSVGGKGEGSAAYVVAAQRPLGEDDGHADVEQPVHPRLELLLHRRETQPRSHALTPPF